MSHPDDFLLPPRRVGARGAGRCGPAGSDGPNLRRACDAELATEDNDCYTPHEIRLEPSLVTAG